MKKYTFLCSLLLNVFMVTAQKELLTLQKCTTIGINNSLQLKLEKLTTAQTKKQKTNYLTTILPQVNLFGRHQYSYGSSIDPNTNSRVSQNFLQDNVSLSARSEILNLQNIYNSKKSRLNFVKSEANQKLIEYRYRSEITSSFFNTLFTQELLKLQQKQFENTTKILERIKQEVKIGSKPKSDLYDITLNYTQEEKRVLETKQQLEIKLQKLANLLNDSNSDYTKKELIYKELNYKTTVKNNNPEIVLASLSKEISNAEYKIKRSSFFPEISLFYNLSSFYSKPLSTFNRNIADFNTQIGNNKYQQVGLQLSFTIFDGFRRSRSLSVAKIEKEKQSVLLIDTKNKVNQKIKIEKLKIKQLTEIQGQLKAVYINAKNSFKTSKAKFESGKIELQVFNLTKNQLLDTEYDVLKNQLELNWTKEKVKQLFGKE